MKLKRVSIKGLNNKVDCDFEFHDDINIVTGINGCGKTTFLKILWYAISGNIERLISEISFESFELETSHYSLSIIRNDSSIEWRYSDDIIEPRAGLCNTGSALNDLIDKHKTSSLFFPTFRRIEGGYAITSPYNEERIENGTKSIMLDEFIKINSINIQDDFDKLSKLLTVFNHKFICSVSTYDLGFFLTSRYANTSKKNEEDFFRFSALISSQIEEIKSDIESDKQEALTILKKLQEENIAINNKRNKLLKPFEILADLVTKILNYQGIKLDSFTIGESIDAIDSRLLSSGEQQMLSFLCYNAFYENSIIFIDEPELSLHADWQRRLFPNLMKQQSSNQFIVATHSPFIYSKYSDKEIILSEDKGE
jgi:predicted ATP-binding protein involved in virulence